MASLFWSSQWQQCTSFVSKDADSFRWSFKTYSLQPTTQFLFESAQDLCQNRLWFAACQMEDFWKELGCERFGVCQINFQGSREAPQLCDGKWQNNVFWWSSISQGWFWHRESSQSQQRPPKYSTNKCDREGVVFEKDQKRSSILAEIETMRLQHPIDNVLRNDGYFSIVLNDTKT